MPFVEECEILNNKLIAKKVMKMTLRSENIAGEAKPGMFVQVSCNSSNTTDPLLRRPISIHNVKGDTFDIIYSIVGRGTELLSTRLKHEKISVVGALGSSYDTSEIDLHVLVGGGCGVPPMYFLAKELQKNINIDIDMSYPYITNDLASPFNPSYEDNMLQTLEAEMFFKNANHICVCIGASCDDLILCEDDFLELGIIPSISTDDGSKGDKGFVTESLKKILEKNKDKKIKIYSCGPTIMMKNVYLLSLNYKNVVSTQFGMENVMACGVGVCTGCVVKIKGSINDMGSNDWHYERVCKEGPVFKGDDLVW